MFLLFYPRHVNSRNLETPSPYFLDQLHNLEIGRSYDDDIYWVSFQYFLPSIQLRSLRYAGFSRLWLGDDIAAAGLIRWHTSNITQLSLGRFSTAREHFHSSWSVSLTSPISYIFTRTSTTDLAADPEMHLYQQQFETQLCIWDSPCRSWSL